MLPQSKSLGAHASPEDLRNKGPPLVDKVNHSSEEQNYNADPFLCFKSMKLA